ncbi:uncharacterized protein PFL1_06838 [Pseudozyma flocculosa PF-1]|uniref:Uncharacterized protein n=1 Tax=Pseudozyma flocculosa TaxID=84751 RepID=A0A5C3F2K1_9BASI|nr:uncharacterized protein PFL1_06838 [Pseudozyma flocculosa PF-1]EPQ31500.1 hypothetical protein PFL1_06838 [Pseudozyma flocculosa PF-1]SPO38714.1 uncharacterized protein PSFLO_04193 [Pseudozyma flocculosa]
MVLSSPSHRAWRLLQLLGSNECSTSATGYLANFGPGVEAVPGETRAFKDVKYRSFKQLGLSLQYEPDARGLRADQCEPDQLKLIAIDLYAEPHIVPSSAAGKGWQGFPALPLAFAITVPVARDLVIDRNTEGHSFVRQLGEPARKGGGGAGVVGGMGPGAWMEWRLTASNGGVPEADDGPATIKFRLMVELGGQAALGHDRWEPDRGGASTWKTVTLISDMQEAFKSS